MVPRCGYFSSRIAFASFERGVAKTGRRSGSKSWASTVKPSALAPSWARSLGRTRSVASR